MKLYCPFCGNDIFSENFSRFCSHCDLKWKKGKISYWKGYRYGITLDFAKWVEVPNGCLVIVGKL